MIDVDRASIYDHHMDKLLDNAQVAEILGIKPATLRKWRHLNKGPRWIKLGRRAMYKPEDVTAWIDTQAENTTN